MEDEKHPYYLENPNESHLDRATNRIAGFIGGGIAGIIFGIIGLVVLTNFGFVPLNYGLYGLLGSLILFAIIAGVWPKWFAWLVDLLSFW